MFFYKIVFIVNGFACGAMFKNLFCSCGQFKHCYLPSNKPCYSKDVENIDFADEYEYLKNIEYNDTVAFVPPITGGRVVKVYDGDTITVASKLPGMDEPIYRFSVRLLGIDSPEIKGKTMKEKELAIESRDALHNLIFGKMVYFKNVSTEKYGRILADVYFGDIHINSWMLQHKLAIKYDGGTKHRPTEWD
jgi:endonuclease YncB( thermonuclease family)